LRNGDKEETVTVATEEGIPIICKGLKDSTRPNGKIGDPRRFLRFIFEEGGS